MIILTPWGKHEVDHLLTVKDADVDLGPGVQIGQVDSAQLNVRHMDASLRSRVQRVFNAVSYFGVMAVGMKRNFVRVLATLRAIQERSHRRDTFLFTTKSIRTEQMAGFQNTVWLWKSTFAAHSRGTKQFTTSTVISRTTDWKTFSFATDDTGKVRLLAVPTVAASTS